MKTLRYKRICIISMVFIGILFLSSTGVKWIGKDDLDSMNRYNKQINFNTKYIPCNKKDAEYSFLCKVRKGQKLILSVVVSFRKMEQDYTTFSRKGCEWIRVLSGDDFNNDGSRENCIVSINTSLKHNGFFITLSISEITEKGTKEYLAEKDIRLLFPQKSTIQFEDNWSFEYIYQTN